MVDEYAKLKEKEKVIVEKKLNIIEDVKKKKMNAE